MFKNKSFADHMYDFASVGCAAIILGIVCGLALITTPIYWVLRKIWRDHGTD